jgi:catechol 2,3-dioxygenase-like lactoylglutathione lyase family enzyme
MIFGLHVLLYSKNTEAARALFRDVLGFRGIDVGGGWLIFRTPPTEMAVHPIDESFTQSHAGHPMSGAILYLMCDDLNKTISRWPRRR